MLLTSIDLCGAKGAEFTRVGPTEKRPCSVPFLVEGIPSGRKIPSGDGDLSTLSEMESPMRHGENLGLLPNPIGADWTTVVLHRAWIIDADDATNSRASCAIVVSTLRDPGHAYTSTKSTTQSGGGSVVTSIGCVLFCV